MTVNLAETSVAKSRPPVPYGANFYKQAYGKFLGINSCSKITEKYNNDSRFRLNL